MVDEVFEDFAHGYRSHETNEVGSDFIGDDEGSESRMLTVAREEEREVSFGIADGVGMFGEEGIPVPRNGEEDLELVFGSEVENFAGGCFVDADGVETCGLDTGEFGGWAECFLGREGTVSDGLDEKRLALLLEESSVN